MNLRATHRNKGDLTRAQIVKVDDQDKVTGTLAEIIPEYAWGRKNRIDMQAETTANTSCLTASFQMRDAIDTVLARVDDLTSAGMKMIEQNLAAELKALREASDKAHGKDLSNWI